VKSLKLNVLKLLQDLPTDFVHLVFYKQASSNWSPWRFSSVRIWHWN